MGKSQPLWAESGTMETRGKHYFWVLRTGAPWKDVPRSKEFAPPATAHAWLGRMHVAGFLDQLLEELLKFAEQIDGERLSIDGFFFQRSRRWRSD
jgi:transposase